MSIQEARDILVSLNRWRRDDNIPSKHEMPNPHDVGDAIDVAVWVLDSLCDDIAGEYIQKNPS